MLILAPTRELANQIATEAKSLLHFYNGVDEAVFVGGVNASRDRTRIAQGAVSVLVLTPGRLIDHLKNIPGFAKSLSHIIDEADKLLDMGFRPDIERILRILPPRTKGRRYFFCYCSTVHLGDC